jgi:hypothetical protein
MEAFESFVALSMQSEGLVVAGATKFKLKLQTRRQDRVEMQVHGYEVDLVGARKDKLVLATVKSFFGSDGVRAPEVTGEAENSSGYKLLNRLEVRNGVVAEAARLYGYQENQIEMRLYAGKFKSPIHEEAVRAWCKTQVVGSGPIQVFSVDQIVDSVLAQAESNTYQDNPVLVALKVLRESERYRVSKEKHKTKTKS